MRERNHHREAAAGETEEIKLLEVASKSARADVLDRPNALVGIHNFLAYLKKHPGTL
jgi:hypothetical protein